MNHFHSGQYQSIFSKVIFINWEVVVTRILLLYVHVQFINTHEFFIEIFSMTKKKILLTLQKLS